LRTGLGSIIDFERDKLTDLRVLSQLNSAISLRGVFGSSVSVFVCMHCGHQDMLMRYIESQLYIHTRAIEELTIAYDAAAKIDVQSDLRVRVLCPMYGALLPLSTCLY